MYGQRVLARVDLPAAPSADWGLTLGWPVLRAPSDLRGGIIPIPRKDFPVLVVDGKSLRNLERASYRYNGVLNIDYRPQNGIRISCAVFPSKTLRVAIEHWRLENHGPALTVEVASSCVILRRTTNALEQACLLERSIGGFGQKHMKTGEAATFDVFYSLRPASEPPPVFDIARERAAREAMFREAVQNVKLETPEPVLDESFAWAKMRLLEAPVESCRGLIQGTGTLSYLGGIWANDNVEYGSPACPFLGDPELNDSCNHMFEVWLNDASPAISPSFESYLLRPCGHDRGDQAMMLYGLSKYLLALGDHATASKFLPLLEKLDRLIQQAVTPAGVVRSRTDELEGRYPTGDANLSTSSLAYGGYRAAEHLARSLGEANLAKDYQARADALAKAIESYFGAEVEGFHTYRYFEGCEVLRGWICLPLAMGIMQRQQGTLDALFSPKLWVESAPGPAAGTKVASTDTGEGWPRETYYTLRAAFKAGRTQLALNKTVTAVRAAMLSARGPYMDEDGGQLLAPNALYVLTIIEGLFGIEPESFDSFTCTPRLPAAWPSMRLQNTHLMGRTVDLAVTRAGQELHLTVVQAGKEVFSQAKPEGESFTVGPLPRENR